jgi:hypothetical protein
MHHSSLKAHQPCDQAHRQPQRCCAVQQADVRDDANQHEPEDDQCGIEQSPVGSRHGRAPIVSICEFGPFRRPVGAVQNDDA